MEKEITEKREKVKRGVEMISVVVNGSETYRNAIESLKTQSYKDFEVVLVTDEKIDLSMFKNHKIITSPKYMEYVNGLKSSTYDKVVFLDGNDSFEKNKLDVVSKLDYDYLHNDYLDNSKFKHKKLPYLNMSCIGVNKSKYSNILTDLITKNKFYAYNLDNLLYWIGIENKYNILSIEEKLTRKLINNIPIEVYKNEWRAIILELSYFKDKKVLKMIKSRRYSLEYYLRMHNIPVNSSPAVISF